MGAALKFKQTSIPPRQQGEQARLKVLQGPDVGAVFVIVGGRATLGRGEENDIMVSDLKASRRHAELTAEPGGAWLVKDMGSANGLLHNGKNTREARVRTGDTLTFGETTLEFLGGESGTMMLVAPPRDLKELQAQREAFEQHRKQVRSFGVIEGGQGAPQAPAQGGSKRLLLYGAVAAAVAFLMLSEDEKPKKPVAKKADTVEDLRKYLPGGAPDPVTARTIEQFYRAGFREYLAGNYLRAKTQFETVLQMSPGHTLATLYLENCERDLKAEVEFHLKQGKRSMDAGRLKESKGHFESVTRILFHDQSNPSYSEAKDQLDKVVKLMNGSGEGG